MDVAELIAAARSGNTRAVGRLLSLVESDRRAEVLAEVGSVTVPVIGVTGPPGAGKSTTIAVLVAAYRERGQRVAVFTRMDRLLADAPESSDGEIGAAYLALHTVRCKSAETQRRFADGARLGPETSIDKVLLAGAEQRLYDTAHDLLPGVLELDETPWRPEYLYSRAATIYGGTAEIQRNIIARRLLDLGKE